MSWKYQLAKETHVYDGEEYTQYGVVEKYMMGKNGQPREGWTAMFPNIQVSEQMDETPTDLIAMLKMMVRDLEKDLEEGNILDLTQKHQAQKEEVEEEK